MSLHIRKIASWFVVLIILVAVIFLLSGITKAAPITPAIRAVLDCKNSYLKLFWRDTGAYHFKMFVCVWDPVDKPNQKPCPPLNSLLPSPWQDYGLFDIATTSFSTSFPYALYTVIEIKIPFSDPILKDVNAFVHFSIRAHENIDPYTRVYGDFSNVVRTNRSICNTRPFDNLSPTADI